MDDPTSGVKTTADLKRAFRAPDLKRGPIFSAGRLTITVKQSLSF
jgi:hypothetical protein